MEETQLRGAKVLQKYSERVEHLLRDFFEEKKSEFSSTHDSDIVERLEEFCLRGGKRLRPALVYYGYRLLGGKDSDDIVKASLVMELLHAFLLIHDDIMDESTLRRGGPTIHKHYEDVFQKVYVGQSDRARRFGESMAILVGDLAHCLAIDLFSTLEFEEELKARVLERLNKSITATIFGQELDLQFEAEGMARFEDVLTMYRLKTAQYTFECPLHVGALLANGGKEDLELLSRYAIPLGIAFQIQDDILGLFGDEEKTGKPVGSDLRQGKQTLLLTKLLEDGSKEHRKVIREVLGKKDISNAEIEKARAVVRESGALAYAKKLSETYLGQTEAALHKMKERDYDKETREILCDIAHFVVERNV